MSQTTTPEIALKVIAKAKKERAKKLQLGRCGLTEIPPEVLELTWLEELDFRNTWWQDGNEVFAKNGGEHNRIGQIPKLNAFKNLRKLWIAGHTDEKQAITEIPKNFLPASLSQLDLSFNQIKKINGLENLKFLDSLDLSDNKITEIIGLDKLVKLSELNLGNNQIYEIKNLEKLGHLVILYLYCNKITEISGLEKLVKLWMLTLFQNQITEIKGLETLKQLSRLDLSHNKITEIKGLENLNQLVKLDLGFNQITEIKGLEKLVTLSSLELKFNRIIEIKGLETLLNLLRLDLSENEIKEINNLTVPFLEQLKSILLNNNPIKGVPFDNFDDRDALLGYLKILHENDTKLSNYHLKLNIIGPGRIGKSQLLHYFSKEKYKANESETHGTQTANYTIPGTEYHATIWDFGGQSYHHGFHYLFLRPKDFYLVLWRNVKDKEPDYAYWLGTARHFANEKDNDTGRYTTPLLLVQNQWTKPDDKNAESSTDEIAYPSSEKLKKYQLGLNDVLCIDVKFLFNKRKPTVPNKYFLEMLHELMKKHCKQIKNLSPTIVSVKKKLDKVQVEEINMTREEFRKQYASEIKDDDKFAFLLQYLEFTGNIITFREVEALSDYVFPNPPRLSDWIYQTVLNDDFKKNNEGKIGTKEILEKTGSEELKTIFLELMKEFRLVFEQPFTEKGDIKDETYYIIPQFLPEYNHSFKQVLLELLPFTFSIKFSDFIHEGRFFKFIAENGKFAKDNSAYWKYGLLFGFELNRDDGNQTPKQKAMNTIQVLAYYITDKRQVMVHIEDKKGRSEVAKELFNYFASVDSERINYVASTGKMRKQKYVVQYDTPNKLFWLEDKDLTDHPLKPFKLLEDILLCTNGYNYLDVKETKANIAANNFFGTCTLTQARVKLDFMTINLLSSETKRKLRIFFSYSHKDEQYRDELDKHFTMLKRNGRIETWHDRKIMPGDNWDATIKQQLETADIVLIMLSADFLNSDYIWEQELGIVRRRIENKDGIKAIPIFVRPCYTAGLDFMDIQGAQQDDQSKLPWISSSDDHDEAYTKIVERIKKAIDATE